MLSRTVIDHLRQKVGAGNVYHEREDLLVYGYDATPEIEGFPEVAVFPENREGLDAALEVSRQEGLAVTPRGAATGLSGGSTPAKGSMVLGITRRCFCRTIATSTWRGRSASIPTPSSRGFRASCTRT